MITQEQFLQKASEKHRNKYDYSKVNFVNLNTKITIICPIHGEKDILPKNHLGSFGCKLCSFKIIKKLNSSFEYFLQLANEQFNNYFDYSDTIYIDYTQKIKIICPKHGPFHTKPRLHLHSPYSCRKCYDDTQRDTQKTFIQKANEIHNFKYDYSLTKYIGQDYPIDIICKIHGVFKQGAEIHLRGTGCKQCSRMISNHETEWLDSINLPNDKIHRQVKMNIKDCGVRYVDGYDPETNTIYEFDGDFWHGNPKFYNPNDLCKPKNKTFGEVYNSTLKRNQCIKEMGFNLITMWHTDWLISNNLPLRSYPQQNPS